jgi:acetylornithine deacetylase
MCDPGFAVPAKAPFVQAVLRMLGQPAPSVAAFSCDASKIAQRGIPTLVLGPGDIAQAHTADESVSLVELRQGQEAYAKIALDFLST